MHLGLFVSEVPGQDVDEGIEKRLEILLAFMGASFLLGVQQVDKLSVFVIDAVEPNEKRIRYAVA
ncbi:MAG: hypothetical protein VW405_11830 [Rhodospirillaceae bacterium]